MTTLRAPISQLKRWQVLPLLALLEAGAVVRQAARLVGATPHAARQTLPRTRRASRTDQESTMPQLHTPPWPAGRSIVCKLTRCRHNRPLVDVSGLPGDGAELRPAELRALAAALQRAADECEAAGPLALASRREYPLQQVGSEPSWDWMGAKPTRRTHPPHPAG